MKKEIEILKKLISIKSTCDISNKEIIFYIKKKLDKFDNYKIKYSSGCPEAGYFKKMGDCVVVGPGSKAQAQKIDEYIKIDKLCYNCSN